MVINIFKNYGCLSSEKRVVYTYGKEHHTAVCSDIIRVKIPDTWKTYENSFGELMVTSPWGWNYQINQVLEGNEFPYFSAVNRNGKYCMDRLEVIDD